MSAPAPRGDGSVVVRADQAEVPGGTVQVLSGEEVLTAGEGDLLVVPPKLPHAFAAALALGPRPPLRARTGPSPARGDASG
jgi:uncharacterized RmlC-like cupin family protein